MREDGLRLTTHGLEPSGTFPIQCLPSKQDTSPSVHLNESWEVRSEVKNWATRWPLCCSISANCSSLRSALAGPTSVDWRWNGIVFAQITFAMQAGQLLSKPPWNQYTNCLLAGRIHLFNERCIFGSKKINIFPSWYSLNLCCIHDNQGSIIIYI